MQTLHTHIHSCRSPWGQRGPPHRDAGPLTLQARRGEQCLGEGRGFSPRLARGRCWASWKEPRPPHPHRELRQVSPLLPALEARVTPCQGALCDSSRTIPGLPVGQASLTAQHRALALSVGGIPTVQEPREKGLAWPRTQADPRILAPAHLTPSCPKTPSCHLGPRAWPHAWQSRKHGKQVWGAEHGPRKNGVGRLCPGKQLALQK